MNFTPSCVLYRYKIPCLCKPFFLVDKNITTPIMNTAIKTKSYITKLILFFLFCRPEGSPIAFRAFYPASVYPYRLRPYFFVAILAHKNTFKHSSLSYRNFSRHLSSSSLKSKRKCSKGNIIVSSGSFT